jgi:hypothetical protein
MTDTEHEHTNLPAPAAEETDNILKAALAGRTPFAKFKKDHFHISGTKLPPGTEYFAYCRDWRRGWRKWKDDQVTDDRMARVADDPSEPVERDELDDQDKHNWPIKDGEQRDPWSLENQLPLENVETGERFIFTSTTAGGRIAIEKLCTHWATSNKKGSQKGLPIIKLDIGKMPTKKYGEVPCPDFKVTGWENDTPDLVEVMRPALTPATSTMDDEIPF